MCFSRQKKTVCLLAVALTITLVTLYRTTVYQTAKPSTRGVASHSHGIQMQNSVKDSTTNTSVSRKLIYPIEQQQDIREVIRQKLVKGTGKYRLSKPLGQLKIANSNMRPPLSWSQYGQDILIDGFFQGKRGGFFIEIGGYDGETNSNTLLLEKDRGWEGLLVEANPYLYKQMLQKDRTCHMINCCISTEVPEMTFLLADALTVADSALSSAHKERIDKERNQSLSGMHYGESITTQCFSLMDILDVIGRRKVDYFSLDVEGGEIYILKSIDWNILDIKYFTIETDQNRDEILAFMEKQGYEWKHNILGDDIFKKIS